MKPANKPGGVAPITLALLASVLVLAAVLVTGSFIKGFFSSVVFYAIVALVGLGLGTLFVWRMVVGPRRASGFAIASAHGKVRKLKWNGLLGYLGGSALILGLVVILAAAAWGTVFGVRRELILTEGEIQPLDKESLDSLYLEKLAFAYYVGTGVPSDNQALVRVRIDAKASWDTVGVNAPIRKGANRIYITGYGTSTDSIYLTFLLKYPEGDTLPYEAPPTTKGLIEDPRFPFFAAFQDFHIDSSHVWPNPMVPEVTVNLLWPGILVSSKRMRAPDSVSVGPYTLYFQGFKYRPAVTFLYVKDQSWILAFAGAGLVFLGLTLGFISRMVQRFGGSS